MLGYLSSDGIPDRTFSMQKVEEKSEKIESRFLKGWQSIGDPYRL
jgi:hypothetical protein